MQTCSFHDYDLKSGLTQKRKLKILFREILSKHEIDNYNLNYIFCSDKHLLSINQKYLKHDTLTDIITFDLSENGTGTLTSDIFISIERVQENAKVFKVDFSEELLRVMIHGILHLVGYSDKTEKNRKKMRKTETIWIKRYVRDILPK